jgi:hypothetical protein
MNSGTGVESQTNVKGRKPTFDRKLIEHVYSRYFHSVVKSLTSPRPRLRTPTIASGAGSLAVVSRMA